MIKSSIIMTFMLLSVQNLYAKTSLIYIGAGGEGNKPNTIFDKNLTEMKTVLERQKWDYTISINGGHPQTEKIVASSFPRAKNPAFTVESYNKILKDLKTKIQNNTYKPGDQVMLFIDSHGAERNKEKTHSISVADNREIRDYNSLAGSKLVSLDKIQEIITLSEAKGLKLGIVDLSCHSGNTLNFKINNAKTCIVTSTGPNHYAFAGNNSFSNKFIQQLSVSPNTLESAFLAARENSNDNSYPMISTPQAESARRNIYDLISPYLQYQSDSLGKLADDIIDQSQNCYACDTDFTRLLKKLNDFKRVGILSSEDTTKLTDKIRQYENLRRRLSVQYNQMKRQAETKETFTSPEIDPVTKRPYYNFSFSWAEMLKTSDHVLNKLAQVNIDKARQMKHKDFENYKRATLQTTAKILKRKKELLASHPKLVNIQKSLADMANDSANTFRIANEIAQLERKIYSDMYLGNRFEKNNACATIRF